MKIWMSHNCCFTFFCRLWLYHYSTHWNFTTMYNEGFHIGLKKFHSPRILTEKKKVFSLFPKFWRKYILSLSNFLFFLWFFLVLCVRDKPGYFAYRLYSAIHVSMAHIFLNFSRKSCLLSQSTGFTFFI